MHVFSEVTVAKAAVMEGIKCGCFVWARPRFLVGLLYWRRNASLAGGFAGRPVFVVFWFIRDLICLAFGTGQLCYVPHFSPLMYLSGPCHRAFTAKLEEKKNRLRYSFSLGAAAKHVAKEDN